ncbi:MAG: toll/interleukin-1 receptor domain-containing protein [Candidatus Helarchaeota archaeon]
MELIEKTVFICYRRSNVPWALAISQNLTHIGYDVFFDFSSIKSGDFEQIITENIRGRAHFIIILTPSALERCNEPNDWFRREIEIALDCKRNIVPVLLEGFDFGAQETINYLTGELENIGNYNGMTLYAEYFKAGMEKLNQFLNISLDKVRHPILHRVSSKIKQIVDEQKRNVAKQAPVDDKILSAQQWFERAYKSRIPEDQIRLYTKAIELDPIFLSAYNNRGTSYAELKQVEKAIEDYNQAIKLNPEYAEAYNNRGILYAGLKQVDKAIEDYNQAIELNPEYGAPFYNKACLFALQGKSEDASMYLIQALKIDSTKYCKLLSDDSDFDKIRGNANFENLLKEFCDNAK